MPHRNLLTANTRKYKGRMTKLTDIASSNKDQTKSVLLISQLDMLKAGNQLLFRMIEGYAAAGYKVVFLTSNPASDPNRADYCELLGPLMSRVAVYRFSPLFRPLAGLIVRVRNLLLSCRFIPRKAPLIDVADTVQFDTSAGSSILGLLSWISFILGGSLKAIWLARHHKVGLIYGYEIYGAPVAWLAARLLRVPLFTKFQGTVAFPELEKGRAWLRIPHHLMALKTPSDLVIMENDGTRGKEVLSRLGVAEEKIRFWVDGVKKEMYIPHFEKRHLLSKLDLGGNSKIVLTLSKLKKWKRVDRAISAIAQVVREIPNVFLIIVGDGEERGNLENLTQRLGVAKHGRFMGAVPHDEVQYFLNGCDVFLSLYDHSNLSNPLLEALECGRCIVTIDDGSTEDLLTNGHNAILLQKEKLSEELPNTIISLLLHDKRCLRIAANARNYAEKYLVSWEERMAMEIREIEALVRQKRSLRNRL